MLYSEYKLSVMIELLGLTDSNSAKLIELIEDYGMYKYTEGSDNAEDENY